VGGAAEKQRGESRRKKMRTCSQILQKFKEFTESKIFFQTIALIKICPKSKV
jgi:hypothetical protein